MATVVFLYTGRMKFLGLALLLLASPALADGPAPVEDGKDAKAYIDPVTLKARAEELRDAVAGNQTSDISLHQRAHSLFGNVSQQPLVLAVNTSRRMEREGVTGEKGSIEGMQKAAVVRIAAWRRTHAEPPPPEMQATLDKSDLLAESKALSYDDADALKANQMGLFKYMRDRLDGGFVKLNDRMKLLGIMVGNAFTYATVAHETQHARDREAGLLTPEEEVAGEVRAFRTQYLYLKMIDPTGERLLTLHGSLKIWRDTETDKKVKVALNEAVVYLEHLSDVVETNGTDENLKKLVERLGYKDGDKHEHEEHESRGTNEPVSA